MCLCVICVFVGDRRPSRGKVREAGLGVDVGRGDQLPGGWYPMSMRQKPRPFPEHQLGPFDPCPTVSPESVRVRTHRARALRPHLFLGKGRRRLKRIDSRMGACARVCVVMPWCVVSYSVWQGQGAKVCSVLSDIMVSVCPCASRTKNSCLTLIIT